jgi:flagellin-like protein
MKSKVTINSRKGETGIGTLIVFIAMILVAAIAASVLLGTGSSLQQRALSTGKQTEREVASGMVVVTVAGDDGSDGGLETLEIILKLSSGSDSISLDDTIITFDTKNSTQSLEYNSSNNNTASEQFYNITYLKKSADYKEGRLSRGDILKIRFNATRAVTENEMVKLRIVAKSGMICPVDFYTPDVISQTRVILYP